MTYLGQRLDRGIAALASQSMFAADNQHMLRNSGVDEMMRQHRHREPRSAADLHCMRILRRYSEVLCKDRREHDVRRNCAVPAENAVDLSPFEARVRDCKLGSPAHEVERRGAFVPAVTGQPDSGDEAHGNLNTTLATPALSPR